MPKATKYNKALVAILGAIVILVNTFTSWKIPVDEGTVASVATVITTILVYLIPNDPTRGKEKT